MHTPANTTVERIMDSAQRLVQQRGVQGFSYRDVAAEVGIRSASVHYHFPTKADLTGAVLDRIMCDFEAALGRLDAERTAVDRLRGFCGLFLDTFDQGERLCPFCMVAVAQDEIPASLRERVTAFWRRGEDWLEALLGEPAFVTVDSPRATARLVVAALEGGMVTARAFGEPQRYVDLADQLVRSVLPGDVQPRSIAAVERRADAG